VYLFPSNVSSLFAGAKARGQSVLPILGSTNPLYDGGKIPSSPAGIAAFGRYAAALVKAFHPRAVEVFNELNNPKQNNSACGVSPDCYLPLLKATYTAVKAADPNVLVVGAATAREDDAWMSRLLSLGGGNYMDAISFHPYNNNAAPEYLAASIPATQALIRKNAGRNIPIWITELGWDDHDVKLVGQVDYLVRSMAIVLGSGVQNYSWYDLVDDVIAPGSWVGEGSFGLFTQDGAPKPAAYSLLELTRQLGGRAAAGREAVGGAVYSYRFGAGDDDLRIAWATTPTAVKLHTTGPVTVTDDLAGRQVLTPSNGVVALSLTASPVYIEGPISTVSLG
jgi:hypothetical protein